MPFYTSKGKCSVRVYKRKDGTFYMTKNKKRVTVPANRVSRSKPSKHCGRPKSPKRGAKAKSKGKSPRRTSKPKAKSKAGSKRKFNPLLPAKDRIKFLENKVVELSSQ